MEMAFVVAVVAAVDDLLVRFYYQAIKNPIGAPTDRPTGQWSQRRVRHRPRIHIDQARKMLAHANAVQFHAALAGIGRAICMWRRL